jgi:hypothetical protein
LIEPNRSMTLAEFEKALSASRKHWKLHCR